MNTFSKIAGVGVIAAGLFASSFTGKLASNVADYFSKRAEAQLLPAPPPAVVTAPIAAAPAAAPKAFIRMSTNSGLSNLTLITGGAQVGILNEGVDNVKFNDLRVMGSPQVGIANRDSTNLQFEHVDVQIGPPKPN